VDDAGQIFQQTVWGGPRGFMLALKSINWLRSNSIWARVKSPPCRGRSELTFCIADTFRDRMKPVNRFLRNISKRFDLFDYFILPAGFPGNFPLFSHFFPGRAGKNLLNSFNLLKMLV
jgi:hypothetical protein